MGLVQHRGSKTRRCDGSSGDRVKAYIAAYPDKRMNCVKC